MLPHPSQPKRISQVTGRSVGNMRARRPSSQTLPSVTILGLTICGFLLSRCVLADSTSVDLKMKSLEELTNIEVISVSKKAEKLSEAAAAVYVITSEDIEQMGVTGIAEALRMAPGLQVARIDASTWAITSRGFSGTFANKLLVLIDGRSVYTPLFSGVYWDVQDVLLQDIDRIEVVRGPGGTLWGANAVNGVINIITKNASETKGVFLKAGVGSEERGTGAFRYGAGSNGLSYRVYGKYKLRDHFALSPGEAANDGWHNLRAGFRADWKQSAGNTFAFSGDIYTGRENRTYVFPLLVDPWEEMVKDKTSLSGGNVLARWGHQFSPATEISSQAYFDRTQRKDLFTAEERNTYDLDIQYHQQLWDGIDLVCGTGLRVSRDHIDTTRQSYAIPSDETTKLFNAYSQLSARFARDRLHFSIGTKVEHNDYTGFEIQPGARLLWLISNRQSAWIAVNRAVRTPSRFERNAEILLSTAPPGDPMNPGPLPIMMALAGNDQFRSEELLAWELGYRVRPWTCTSFDLSLFNNRFDHLRSTEAGNPIPQGMPPSYTTLPLLAWNNAHGSAYGGELAVEWKASDLVALKGFYSYLKVVLHTPATDLENQLLDYERSSPQNQARLAVTLGPIHQVELGAQLRYVDRLGAFDVPSYFGVDVRLAWKPVSQVELAITGQNLLDRYHLEYKPEFTGIPTFVERGMYGTITWSF